MTLVKLILSVEVERFIEFTIIVNIVLKVVGTQNSLYIKKNKYFLRFQIEKISYLPGCNVNSRISNTEDVVNDLSSIASLSSG